MKCVKAIKDSKYNKTGAILRVSDKDADEKVNSGYWMFIPKSEWKLSMKQVLEEEKSKETDQKVKNIQKNKEKGKIQKKVKKNLEV